MGRRASGLALTAALAAGVTPSVSHAYQLCVWMSPYYDLSVYVGQGWWNAPRPVEYETCVDSVADGAVEVAFLGQPTRWSCGITVAPGNQAPVKLVVERVNPGISGVQPFLRCQRKTW